MTEQPNDPFISHLSPGRSDTTPEDIMGDVSKLLAMAEDMHEFMHVVGDALSEIIDKYELTPRQIDALVNTAPTMEVCLRHTVQSHLNWEENERKKREP